MEKKLQQQIYENDGFSYYIDILIGGYKYVENGVEVINTLPLLSQNLSPFEYTIAGDLIAGPNSPFCLNCGPNDRKVLLTFEEPNREIFGYEPEMIFQRVDSGGVQKLKLNFRTISGRAAPIGGTVSPYTTYSVPFGEYVLIKQ